MKTYRFFVEASIKNENEEIKIYEMSSFVDAENEQNAEELAKIEFEKCYGQIEKLYNLGISEF